MTWVIIALLCSLVAAGSLAALAYSNRDIRQIRADTWYEGFKAAKNHILFNTEAETWSTPAKSAPRRLRTTTLKSNSPEPENPYGTPSVMDWADTQ